MNHIKTLGCLLPLLLEVGGRDWHSSTGEEVNGPSIQPVPSPLIVWGGN